MTPRQIAFLFSFPANSKSLPAHAPATNNRTVCRNHFNPYLFIYKLYCFLFLLNPWRSEDDAERTRSFEKVTIVDDVRVVYTTVLMRFEKVDAVARCVYCVCVCTRSASLCVCMTIWLWNIHPKERRKKTRSRLSFFFSPHRLVYTRESLWKTGRERDDVAHTVDDEEKKKIFLKIWNKKKELCLLQACWNSLPSSFACRTRAEAQKKEERFCSPFRMVTGFFFFISNLF